MTDHADRRFRPLATLFVDLHIAAEDQRPTNGDAAGVEQAKAVEKLNGAAEATEALNIFEAEDVHLVLEGIVERFGHCPQDEPARGEWRQRAIDETTFALVYG